MQLRVICAAALLAMLLLVPFGITAAAQTVPGLTSGVKGATADVDRYCMVFSEFSDSSLTPEMAQEFKRIDELTGKKTVLLDVTEQQCFTTERALREFQMSRGVQGIPGVDPAAVSNTSTAAASFYITTLYKNWGIRD